MSETIEPTTQARAQRVKKVEYLPCFEVTLQRAATIFLWLGILAAAVSFAAGLILQPSLFVILIPSLAAGSSGVIAWLLLKAMAEILQCLHDIASGRIGANSSNTRELVTCSACGSPVSSIAPRCFHCNAEFEK